MVTRASNTPAPAPIPFQAALPHGTPSRPHPHPGTCATRGMGKDDDKPGTPTASLWRLREETMGDHEQTQDRDQPRQRDLTDREADWQQYGKLAASDDGRPQSP